MNENLREMNRRLMMFDLQRSWPMAMLKYNPAENFWVEFYWSWISCAICNVCSERIELFQKFKLKSNKRNERNDSHNLEVKHNKLLCSSFSMFFLLVFFTYFNTFISIHHLRIWVIPFLDVSIFAVVLIPEMCSKIQFSLVESSGELNIPNYACCFYIQTDEMSSEKN